MVKHDNKIQACDSVWLDKVKFDEAEKLFREKEAGNVTQLPSLAQEIACARQRIRDSIEQCSTSDLTLVKQLQTTVETMQDMMCRLQTAFTLTEKRIDALEMAIQNKVQKKEEVVKVADEKDDDDLDLFGSDEEDESAAKLREERLKAYESKKSKKPALVAKSSVILDVKPWDDETDMKQMEAKVREVASDGLVWGASKLMPLAYGIMKLQIVAVVEDEKVSIDWLQETIQEIEELVQSVDIAAFNKL